MEGRSVSANFRVSLRSVGERHQSFQIDDDLIEWKMDLHDLVTSSLCLRDFSGP